MSIFTDIDLRRYNERWFVTYPLCDTSITPAGYDLRIGAAVVLRNNDPPEAELVFSEHGLNVEKIEIPPNSSLLVVTREFVWLSGRVSGLLFCRGSYATLGVSIAATTIDPNWSGQMVMRINNVNQHRGIEIFTAQPFCTMSLFWTSSRTGTLPTGGPRSLFRNISWLYGETAKSLLTEYVNTSENNRAEVHFNGLVEKARRYSNASMLRRILALTFER